MGTPQWKSAKCHDIAIYVASLVGWLDTRADPVQTTSDSPPPRSGDPRGLYTQL